MARTSISVVAVSSHCAAGTPLRGSMRMSAGASWRKEKPRSASSNWKEDTPRSKSTPSKAPRSSSPAGRNRGRGARNAPRTPRAAGRARLRRGIPVKGDDLRVRPRPRGAPGVPSAAERAVEIAAAGVRREEFQHLVQQHRLVALAHRRPVEIMAPVGMGRRRDAPHPGRPPRRSPPPERARWRKTRLGRMRGIAMPAAAACPPGTRRSGE